MAVTKKDVPGPEASSAAKPPAEQRADMTFGRELASYKYVGGMDEVTVYVDGIDYHVAKNHEIKVRAGALDNHPEFTRVNREPKAEKQDEDKNESDKK